MQYKNLNSLSRAYRSGDVDRSNYIRQRRQLIDTITGEAIEGNEGVSATNPEPSFDEATTVISSAAELAGVEDAQQENHPRPRKRVMLAITLVAVAAVCGIFYLMVTR